MALRSEATASPHCRDPRQAAPRLSRIAAESGLEPGCGPEAFRGLPVAPELFQGVAQLVVRLGESRVGLAGRPKLDERLG